VVQRAERSPQYCLGPMWTMYSSLRATLGLEQAAVASAPLCTPVRVGRPDGEEDADPIGMFRQKSLQAPTVWW
jgi:hypothetical protein